MVFLQLTDNQRLKISKVKALQYSKLIRHRGPDWSGNVVQNSTILCHERLAIVGLDSGAQPIVSPDGNFTLAVNGKSITIFN